MTQLCVGEEDQARSGLSAFEFPVILGVEKMPPQTVSALQQAVVGRRPALPILGTGFATIDGNGCRTQLSREPRLGGPVRRRAGCRRRAGAVDLPPVGRCRAAVSWNTSSWRTASSWNTAST
ncbi:uncharacterized protein [Lolium perenne]|uniref:uncharacterized protein isoform X3 n=1 Tax=Lolium perenne TaxID=4522 RepID=UPI003A994F00